MASFGSLHIGVSGLNVSQAALNVTAHNLANVDTKGFVRQQVVQADFGYIKLGENHLSSLMKGMGADFAEIKQVRDYFLDQAYRQEIGRQAFYEAQYEAVYEIEGLFGELEGESFQEAIDNFWVAMQELAKEPDNIVARSSFVETAVNFIDHAENISKQLKDYQINLNAKIKDQVDKINQIGDEIRELNLKIRKYESNGEKANDLRDQRNNLLDELSKMVSITYKENSSSMVYVSIEGAAFVDGDNVYYMGTAKVNDGTDMLKPVWLSHGNVDVFNLDRAVSSDNNNDIGSLKGLLVARGYKQAKYTDIPVRENFESESLYEKAVLEYNNTIGASVIMNIQAQFDQLIHGIVTTINDILCPNREVTLADGTKVKIFDEDKAPVGSDPAKTMGEALFDRKSTPRYTEPQELTILKEDGTTETITARIYNEENPEDNYSLFTLGEIMVNPNILHNYALIPLSINAGTGDFDIETAKKLLEAWQTPFASISPNSLTKNNFSDYYNSFISEVANLGEQYRTIKSNQATMVESIDNKRMEITAVSSDEELTNMIRYQHAYNASARYINVISEMLKDIIEKL